MKKEDFKHPMWGRLRNGVTFYVIPSDGEKLIVQSDGDVDPLDDWDDELKYNADVRDYDIMDVYGMQSSSYPHKWVLDFIMWERKEEKQICTIDGVNYSEDTLRSLIKKATNG